MIKKNVEKERNTYKTKTTGASLAFVMQSSTRPLHQMNVECPIYHIPKKKNLTIVNYGETLNDRHMKSYTSCGASRAI